MTHPTVHPAAERAYTLLEPLLQDDEANDWAALHIVAALTVGEQPVWALAEDPGASVTLNPATCDPMWLPLVAQMVGGRLRGGMTLAQQRAECVRPIGWTAGIAVELAGIALAHMVENGRVAIRWRYDGTPNDSPARLSVRVKASDVLAGHETAVVRDLGDAIPAWLVADIEVADYATFDDRRDQHANFDEWASTYTDFNDLRDR